MKIGYMNSPFRPIDDEFAFAAKNDFDFLEFTIEPPRTAIETIKADQIKKLIEKHKMPVPVGHNLWYLPYANPVTEIRDASLSYLEKCLVGFNSFGVRSMNIHTNFLYSRKVFKEVLKNHVHFLQELVKMGKRYNLTIMLETIGTKFDTAQNIGHIFREVKDLYFHFDSGHANITETDGGLGLIKRFGKRIRHVHISDNDGVDDQHLPLGCGNSDIPAVLQQLKAIGYRGTFTIEVFCQDRKYLLISRDKLRKIWQETK